MSGYFSFSVNNADTNNLEVRVIFKGYGPTNVVDLAGEIKQSTRHVPFPDMVVIICNDFEFDLVENELKTDTSKLAIKRFSDRTSLHLISFGKDGDAIRSRAIANGRSIFNLKGERFFSCVREVGSATLFSINAVLVSAPPGFRFRKPSQKYASHFIRAEEALANSECVEFVAFSILKRIAESSVKDKLEVVFVDSMSIASVAYAIRHIYLLYNTSFRVESFHSHDGLKSINAPVPSSAFCIISASSSMALEQSWVDKVKCDINDVVTLITLQNAVAAEKAIVRLSVPDTWREEYEEGAGLRDLQIFGERFYPQQLPIKRVVLAIRHADYQAKELSKIFSSTEIVSVNIDDKIKKRILYVDDKVLTKNNSFLDWIRVQLKPYLINLPQAIIFQNDAGSLYLAELFREILNVNLPLIDGELIDSGGFDFDRSKPLLIVAAVVSRGTRLQAITRDLRDKHIGPENFFIGIQLSESFEQITYLRSSLTQSKGKNHTVAIFQAIAMGGALLSAFDDEAKLYRENLPVSSVLKHRSEMLFRRGLVVANDTFLPTVLSKKLVLRPDFAFWEDGYEAGPDLAPLVLLTVGAALQSAREIPQTDSKFELRSNAMQQVVLDPLVFMRYNDGIIQAAILRQSYPPELDYSSLPEQSRMMRTILEGQIKFRDRPQGEAVLEFALALRLKKIKLSYFEHEKFMEFCKVELSGGLNEDILMALLSLNPIDAVAEF